jgi:hypothetical protein
VSLWRSIASQGGHVDDVVSARTELTGSGAQSDGLADANLAGDDAQQRLADAKRMRHQGSIP